jgi:hypothetical protein
MHTRTETDPGWLKPLVAGWTERWHSWRARNRDVADLAACGDDLARMAADIGLSAPELRALAAHDRHGADLLRERLAALRLDPEVIAARRPVIMRDLQRLCTLCTQKGRCTNDLMRDPQSSEWESYCPNVETLHELGTRP